MTEAQAIQLIDLVKRGNTNAFEKLVLHYQNMVFSFVYNMVRNQMDAEELTQDVFVKAFRKIDIFRGESKFSTWLFTIARNTVASSFRKKQLETIDVDDSKTAHLEIDEVDNAFDLLSSNFVIILRIITLIFNYFCPHKQYWFHNIKNIALWILQNL